MLSNFFDHVFYKCAQHCCERSESVENENELIAVSPDPRRRMQRRRHQLAKRVGYLPHLFIVYEQPTLSDEKHDSGGRGAASDHEGRKSDRADASTGGTTSSRKKGPPAKLVPSESPKSGQTPGSMRQSKLVKQVIPLEEGVVCLGNFMRSPDASSGLLVTDDNFRPVQIDDDSVGARHLFVAASVVGSRWVIACQDLGCRSGTYVSDREKNPEDPMGKNLDISDVNSRESNFCRLEPFVAYDWPIGEQMFLGTSNCRVQLLCEELQIRDLECNSPIRGAALSREVDEGNSPGSPSEGERGFTIPPPNLFFQHSVMDAIREISEEESQMGGGSYGVGGGGSGYFDVSNSFSSLQDHEFGSKAQEKRNLAQGSQLYRDLDHDSNLCQNTILPQEESCR